jgi:hypothetical protein
MKLTGWIRQQVERLEEEISTHSVFSTSEPATHEELADLRAKVALHTYLKQQLTRREARSSKSAKTESAKPELVKSEFVKPQFVKTDSGRFEAVSV